MSAPLAVVRMDSDLNAEETYRYSRHLLLPELGKEGQLKLKNARALVLGAGGLGSPILLYLAAAGVGTIGIADLDIVDRSNLQRQILFSDRDVGREKVALAASRVAELNPQIQIRQHNDGITAENAIDLVSAYDLVLDGTDNFSTRYLINDACLLLNKPDVHGAIYRFEGQASVFCLQGGPCYRCLFPQAPQADAVPNCAEAGVLGVIAGIIGCIQASEALKIILGIGNTLSGRLMLYDALSMTADFLPLHKNPDCPACGKSSSVEVLHNLVRTAAVRAVCNVASEEEEISAHELKKQIQEKEIPILLDVRTPQEVAICKISASINIPLAELPYRLAELSAESRIVVYCKTGGRSTTAQKLLAQNGFKNVLNLSGGINAWRSEVEPGLAVY